MPTSGVAIAAKANARSVDPARRTEVEDTAGTIGKGYAFGVPDEADFVDSAAEWHFA
jgi:hypothetical protein